MKFNSLSKSIVLMLSFLAFLLSSFNALQAQSVVGKWKRQMVNITDKEGKTSDIQKILVESLPCAGKIIYELTSNGLQKTIIPEECKKAMSPMAKLFVDVDYSYSGNKITIKSADIHELPDAVYVVRFQAGDMIWDFDYAQNPKTPNPTKAKKMSIVYKRI